MMSATSILSGQPLVHRALLRSAATMALAVSTNALAQQSSNADAAATQASTTDSVSAPDGQAAAGIEEIIVTAQRREESLQRAAIAVDVVSGDSLISAGVTKAADLSVLVPSLQVANNGGSNTSFYLRGVGAFTSNSYSDPAIAFNYDGVYIGRPAGTSGVFYDVARVEVLKGPQGTLYGRNATGGAINVLPVKPRVGETSGFINAGYGNYDSLSLQGGVNLSLSDRMAARISGTVINRDGYLSDGTSDDEGYALRAQVLVEPTDDLNVRLASDYYHAGGSGGGASYVARTLYNPVTQTYTVQPSGLTPDIGLLDPRSGVFLTQTFSGLAGRTTTPLQRQPFLDNDTFGVNAEINWSTGLGTLTVVPAYRRFKQFGIQDALGFLIRTDEVDEQYSLEGRFATDATKRLSAIVGGFYYKEDVTSDFSVQQQVLDSFQQFTQSTESLAAFGRLTFRLTNRVRFVAGGRYTTDTKRFDGVADVLLTICTTPAIGCPGAPLLPFGLSANDVIAQLRLVAINPSNSIYIRPGDPAAARTVYRRGITPINQQRTDEKFTYRLGAEADIGSASLVYLSYETGFRSGGFAFSLFNPTFGPENIKAFTVGAKNRFLDNRLQLNVEGFYWKYRDQQVSHQGTDPNVGQAFFTENIGRSTNKGIEVELQFRPVPDTRLSVDVQYLDAKYDSFVYTVPAFAAGNPTPPPLVGCAVTRPPAISPTATYSIDCSGKQAFRSPTWTVNLGIAQTVHIGDLNLIADVNTHYQSANNTGFEFLDIQRVSSYWVSNAALTLELPKPDWTMSAFVNNIENKRYGTFTFRNDTVATISQVTTPPRTFGARLAARF